jgi:hypothetical protein
VSDHRHFGFSNQQKDLRQETQGSFLPHVGCISDGQSNQQGTGEGKDAMGERGARKILLDALVDVIEEVRAGRDLIQQQILALDVSANGKQ